jgi:hypothetical protein
VLSSALWYCLISVVLLSLLSVFMCRINREGQIWVLARKSRELGALQGVRRCDVLCVWKPGMKGMKGGQLLPGSTGVSIENVIACG